MQITMRRRIARAWRDTRWFNLKFDILPGAIPALVLAAVTYARKHGPKDPSVGDLVLPVGAGLVALAGYWALINGIELVWNYMRSGERIAREEVDRLKAQVGDPDKRQKALTAISVLTNWQKVGADRYKKAWIIFNESVKKRDEGEWEAAIEDCRDWIRVAQNTIEWHCPEYIGEFESFSIGGGLFEEGNARRGRLAEILRQLRLSAGL